MYFNNTHHSYTIPGQHDSGDIFKVTGAKVKVTNTLSGGGITIDENRLVSDRSDDENADIVKEKAFNEHHQSPMHVPV